MGAITYTKEQAAEFAAAWQRDSRDAAIRAEKSLARAEYHAAAGRPACARVNRAHAVAEKTHASTCAVYAASWRMIAMSAMAASRGAA